MSILIQKFQKSQYDFSKYVFCLYVLGSLVPKDGQSVSESLCLHLLSIQNVL